MAENHFGIQFCDKNWFYIFLEPCFVQKFSKNGQKVKFVTLLNFNKNYFLTKNIKKADILGLEIPSKALNAIELRNSH